VIRLSGMLMFFMAVLASSSISWNRELFRERFWKRTVMFPKMAAVTIEPRRRMKVAKKVSHSVTGATSVPKRRATA